jgi:hypothetical protein
MDGEAIVQRISKLPTSDGVVKVELTEQGMIPGLYDIDTDHLGLMNAYQMAKEMAKDRLLKAGF